MEERECSEREREKGSRGRMRSFGDTPRFTVCYGAQETNRDSGSADSSGTGLKSRGNAG